MFGPQGRARACVHLYVCVHVSVFKQSALDLLGDLFSLEKALGADKSEPDLPFPGASSTGEAGLERFVPMLVCREQPGCTKTSVVTVNLSNSSIAANQLQRRAVETIAADKKDGG